MSVFKACDIRGVYPDELDEALYARLGRAIGTLLRERAPRPQALVACDVRPSSPGLAHHLVQGLLATGCEVLDLGIAATPMAYFTARTHSPDGVAIVTASHNPPEYNGLKLCLGPLPVTPAEMARLERTAASGRFATGTSELRALDVEQAYLDSLAATARPGGGFRFVLDCGNGTASRPALRLLRRLQYDPVPLYCTPDGRFPNRSPNPSVPENLAALCHRVRQANAAFGAALDGDGDRLALVDDEGRPLTGDQAILLLARHALGDSGQGEKVVCDLKCSQAVLEAIQACGATPLHERSGHAFIKTRMVAEGARFGGELSGHFFYRELEGGDDALYALLRVAELARDAGQPLSALVNALPHYPITPDIRVPYDRPDGPARLDELAAAADGNILRLDGVRVAYPDGWALARCSVTEPVLTFRFEAYEDAPRVIAERFLAPAPDLQRLVLERLDA